MTSPDDDTARAPLTVLALHGNGGGAFRFSRLPERSADGVALVAIDLPGFGGRPIASPPLTLDELADAVRSTIAELDGPVVVLGHGIGGSVALEALQSRRGPHGAAGLILHAPVAARLDTRRFPKLMRPNWVRRTVQLAISSWPARQIGRRLLFRGHDVPPAFADDFLAAYRTTEAFGAMFDLLDADWFGSLEPIDVPGVILWGGGDRILGADQADDVAAVVPGAERVVVDDWSHFPMVEVPDAYATRIGDLAAGLVAT